jgi:hypothetical protein
MVKKSALKQKPLAHRASTHKIRKVGKKINNVVKGRGLAPTLYDTARTASHNMAQYNLCLNPNDMNKSKQLVAAIPEDQRNILPYHMLLREEEHSIFRNMVLPAEQNYLIALEKKYQRNYKKMALDTKLNYFQNTPKQLEKKFTKFDEYLQWEKQRLVEKEERKKRREELEKQQLLAQEQTPQYQEQESDSDYDIPVDSADEDSDSEEEEPVPKKKHQSQKVSATKNKKPVIKSNKSNKKKSVPKKK